MNPYKILNLDKNASDSEIRKSYIKLARIYHPDRNRTKPSHIQSQYEEKFKEINEAYGILLGKKGYGNSNVDNGLFSNFRDGKYSEMAEKVMKEAALFSKYFFDIVEDKTEHINVNLNIELFDIYNNIAKEFPLTIKKKCKSCMGMGVSLVKRDFITCDKCGGIKFIDTERTFKIYSGEGRQIFFKQSNEEYGKKTGNIIINITAKPNKKYKKINENDLLLYIYGDETNFKHLDNKMYTISGGEIEYYKMYKFKGMGLLNHTMSRGDLYVQKIMEPFRVSEELELINE